MNLLYCSEPLNNKTIDSEWKNEYLLAQAQGMQTHLFDYEMLRHEKDIKKALSKINSVTTKELCIYRGWMMPVEIYSMLYHGLLERNLQLINNPYEYKHCYYLPESYALIESMTPKSAWISKIDSADLLKQALSSFDGKPIIIKDYVKSQKHHWFDACYIPDSQDFEHAQKIINKFIELQGDNLEGGLVFREFVELESIGIHSKSKMPLTKEYRIFVLNKKPVSVIRYWDDMTYNDKEIPISKFKKIFTEVKSNFFTLDIAKLKNGDWVIIELGDGQVAEHMGSTGLENFYQQLSTAS